mgnify:FL=1
MSLSKRAAPWLVSALQQAVPIILGYLPIGFAYGVLAQKTGLSGVNTLAMSLLVFAGSAQLIAVGLFAAGAGPASIILTTFIVNLRHLLMSAALAPYLRGWRPLLQALFAFELTDETFALHSSRFPGRDLIKPEIFSVNIIAQSAWLAGTFLGLVASTLISDITPIGLDYALPAMFIVLLVWQVTSIVRFSAAVLGGLFSIIFFLTGWEQFNVILATMLAATCGLGVDAWIRRPSS